MKERVSQFDEYSDPNGLIWQNNWLSNPFLQDYKRQSDDSKYVFKKT